MARVRNLASAVCLLFAMAGAPVRVVAAASQDPLFYLEQGIQQMEHEQGPTAIANFDKAIKLKPDFALNFLARAHCRILLNDDQNAIKDLNRAIKLDPDLTGAYSRRGYCLCRLGDFKNGLMDLDFALAHQRVDFDRWNDNVDYLNRVKAYKRLGMRAEAQRDANLVATLQHIKEAVDKRTMLDVRGAAEIMDRVVQQAPQDLSAHYIRGIISLNDSSNEKALQDFNFAISKDPLTASLYYFRAEAYSKMGKLQNAIDEYTRLIKMNPTVVAAGDTAETGRCNGAGKGYDEKMVRVSDIYVLRGEAQARLRKPQLALQDISTAIKLNPADIEARVSLAARLIDGGKLKPAIAECNKALLISPQHVQVLEIRSAAFERAGQLPRAIDDVSKMIAKTGSNSDAYMRRGNLYVKNKEYAKAIEDYSHILKLAKAEDDVLICRGEAYFKSGQYEKALADYSRALELDPKANTSLYAVRAQVYERLGKADLAAQDRAKATKAAKPAASAGRLP